MPKINEPMPIVFVRYAGTANGLASQDTTACADSLASMMANAVLVLGPFPSDFQNDVSPARDPSTYHTDT